MPESLVNMENYAELLLDSSTTGLHFMTTSVLTY